MKMLPAWRKAASLWWKSAAMYGFQKFEQQVKLLNVRDVAQLQPTMRCIKTVASPASRGEPRRRPAVSHEADDRFLHVLRCEVEDLMKKVESITARKPPKPFTLVKDEPGELEITLNRIFGLEDISISCILQLVRKEYRPKPEAGQDPEARSKMLQLTISVTKGAVDPVLKILCECYRDGFVIHQVDLETEEKEQTVYRPYFSESKRELVNNFQVFLYERGLNTDLVKYMELHLEKKRLLKSANMWEKLLRYLLQPVDSANSASFASSEGQEI